jgi:hypothetical protein
MPAQAARPDVANLMFRVIGRSVHPELVNTVASTVIRGPWYNARVLLSDAGHLVEVDSPRGITTELVCTADGPVPFHRQILSRKLRGQRSETVEPYDGLVYQVSFQVEHVDADVFDNLHNELLQDRSRARLCHEFRSSSRLTTAAMSLVHAETTAGVMYLQTFHTFPGNRAIVKTQSMFEWS